jgi:hypothetical protein
MSRLGIVPRILVVIVVDLRVPERIAVLIGARLSWTFGLPAAARS